MHIFHALFTPTRGGIEESYLNISKMLMENGHRVSALLRGDAPYATDVAAYVSGIDFVSPRGFYDVRAMWLIRRKLKRLRPDIIVAHAPRAIVVMRYAAMGLGIPVCGVVHSYRVARALNADRLAVLTEHMRDFVVKHNYPADRISVLPNIIAVPQVMPVLRPQLSPFCIGAMGRFTSEKGFDRLIESVAILHQKGIAVQLYLAGAGADEALLRQHAQELGIASQVVFEGWVQDKDSFFAKLDVFCVPSLEESFGIVLLESMIHGVPIVATDAPGPASLLSSDKDGLLVPKGDAQAMSDAIERVMLSPELRHRLVHAAWVRVQDFSVQNIAVLWNDALLKTLKSKSVPIC